MFQRFWSWIKAIFGRSPQESESAGDVARAEQEYRRIDGINFGVIFGQKLSNIAFSDSSMEITAEGGGEGGPRAAIVRETLNWAMRRARRIATQVMATGGRVIVPRVSGGKIKCDVVAQERLYIIDGAGDEITSAAILCDSARIDGQDYYRWVGYTLAQGRLEIRNRATDAGGRQIPLTMIEAWANIEPEYAIANVERMPFAYLKCPTDNRRDKDMYGAAITHGSEALIDEIKRHMKTIAREYRLTRPMLGLDSTMWKRRQDGSAEIDGMRRTVQDSDDPFIPVEGYVDGGNVPWMIYAPAIRDEAMYHRLDRLFELLEKSIGTSKGILTSRETANATATEIKAANHDTFTMVAAIREMWARGMDDLAYAADVLAENAGLAGAHEDLSITFDWDMSLFESSSETFSQMIELQAIGALSKAELRQWVRGGTLEEAEEAVAQIARSEGGAQDDGLEAILAEE